MDHIKTKLKDDIDKLSEEEVDVLYKFVTSYVEKETNKKTIKLPKKDATVGLNKTDKKFCHYCERLLDNSQFYARQGRCKSCRSVYMKNRRKKQTKNGKKTQE